MTIHTVNRWRGVVLVCCAVFTGVLLSGYLGYRAAVAKRARHNAGITDLHLCMVLRTIVSDGDPNQLKPGDPGYSYYLKHPVELRASEQQYQRTLTRLNCRHLPTAKN